MKNSKPYVLISLLIALMVLPYPGYTISEDEFSTLLSSARQGNAEAQYKIGRLFDDGQEMYEDDVMAFYWYEKAAVQGHKGAQFRLGKMLEFGDGYISINHKRALRFYKKAAEQGHPGAQYALGRMYAEGKGIVGEDVDRAIFWFQKAAEDHESVSAQYALGIMYVDRVEPPQYAKGASWFRKAADKGHARAQYELGKLYASGDGVHENDVKAYCWLGRAQAQGLDNAKLEKNKLAKEMDRDEIIEAQKLLQARC